MSVVGVLGVFRLEGEIKVIGFNSGRCSGVFIERLGLG